VTLSVPQPVHVDLLLVKRGTAGPPATEQANGDDDEITSVDELAGPRIVRSIQPFHVGIGQRDHGCYVAPRLKASKRRRTISTFSRDIAYSTGPAASSASPGLSERK
jgi:hypothetical protein